MNVVTAVAEELRALANVLQNLGQVPNDERVPRAYTDRLETLAELLDDQYSFVPPRPESDRVTRAVETAEQMLSELKEPRWIVNDLNELGVQVNGRFFFLYKGENLEYGSDHLHDATCGPALEGKPMRYRPVYKREFGEVCRPVFPVPGGGEGWQDLPGDPKRKGHGQ